MKNTDTRNSYMDTDTNTNFLSGYAPAYPGYGVVIFGVNFSIFFQNKRKNGVFEGIWAYMDTYTDKREKLAYGYAIGRIFHNTGFNRQ